MHLIEHSFQNGIVKKDKVGRGGNEMVIWSCFSHRVLVQNVQNVQNVLGPAI